VKFKLALTLLVSLALILISSPSVKAASPVLLFDDNFDNGSFSKWSIISGSWQITNILGSNRFGSSVPYGNTEYLAIAGDNSWSDYTYNTDILATEGSDKNILFRYNDNQNKYGIHLVNYPDHTYDLVCLEKWINGAFEDVCKHTELYNNQILSLSVESKGQHIKVNLNNSLLIEEPNWGTITHGKIGLRPATGANFPTSIWYDNIKVYDLTTPTYNLDVPLLKQNSPSWGNIIYDRAKDWAKYPNFYIKNWGCALTSATMVLNYYGINKIDKKGTNLDPASLNNWLISQKDGYVNGGYVNWWAIRRLTSDINKVNGTSILDFEKITNPPPLLPIVDTHLASSEADIAAVNNGGHYVVITGKTGSEYSINDPLKDYQTLTDYNNQVSSIGHFFKTTTLQPLALQLTSPQSSTTPNFSTVLINFSPGTDVYLADMNGGLIIGKTPSLGDPLIPEGSSYGYVDPLLSDPEGIPNGPGYNELVLPLPTDRQYKLGIWSNSHQSFTATVYGYDKDGQVDKYNTHGCTQPNTPIFINFNYSQKNGIRNLDQDHNKEKNHDQDKDRNHSSEKDKSIDKSESFVNITENDSPDIHQHDNPSSTLDCPDHED
jgi:hypothetical protein